MIRLIFLILLSQLLLENAFSQDNSKHVVISSVSAKTKGDTIYVKIIIKNNTDSVLSVYRPGLSDINFHILRFYIYDSKEQKPVCRYNLGNDSQLDQIECTNKCFTILKSGEEFALNFPLYRKFFRCKLWNSRLKKLSVDISISKGEIICKDCTQPLFYGALKAETDILYED